VPNGERMEADAQDLLSRLEDELHDQRQVIDEAEDDDLPGVRFSISSYGADYTVDSLVKRVRSKAFFVPDFQRMYVWNLKQASRFIESLLIGLPVPGIFVYRQSDTGRHLIVDGQQRLKSLQYFYDGYFRDDNLEFRLTSVQDPWVGRSYKELDEVDRLRLDDSIIHTTIFKQEIPKKGDRSVYEVFERINTGGTKLSDQEIRVCVNIGEFTSLLRRLNESSDWREMYGKHSARLKDEELILRLLALIYAGSRYKRPMRVFLDQFLEENANLVALSGNELSSVFISTMKFIRETLGARAFRPQSTLNAAVFDAVGVATAELIKEDPNLDKERYRSAYFALLRDDQFVQAYTRSTADENQLKVRIERAKTLLGAARLNA
jgi:hypothetical protein